MPLPTNGQGITQYQETQSLRSTHEVPLGTQISTYDFAKANKEPAIDHDDDNDSSDDDKPSAAQSLLRSAPHHRPSNPVRRLSFVEDGEAAPVTQESQKKETVTWMSLPRKDQLAILTLARVVEPLTERGIQAYLFYQLKSFDTNLSDSQVSTQGGYLTASFAASQFVTAVLWGRAADSPRCGRKAVLIIGLTGTLISCLGIGFAKSFTQAIIFRSLGGAVNGNIGVMRTMISEIVKEKKYQSRAFLLLPMCFNIGIVIGPIVGGLLADPINSLPWLFGKESIIGGKDGVGWMKTFPYALPNLFSLSIILIALLGIIFGLDETHHALKDKPDFGRRIGKSIVKLIKRQPNHEYSEVSTTADDHTGPSSVELESQAPEAPARSKPSSTTGPRLPFYRIFTPNVLLTLVMHFLLACHISTFNAIIFILLPAPRSPSPPPQPHNLFRFTGGLGLPASKVGLATAIIGFIGFPLQILLYPRLHTRWGTLKCYRIFLPFSPLAYLLIPYLTLLPNYTYIIWPALTVGLALQVISRTFALPGAIILINNSCPSPAVLGTIHGVAQSVSSGARTLGPLIGGWALGQGLKHNIIGAVWWGMAAIATIGWCISWVVYEGDGSSRARNKDVVAKPERAEGVDSALSRGPT